MQKKLVSNVAFHCYLQKVVTPRVRIESEVVAPANFARVSKPLLQNEGTIVYKREGTRIPSLWIQKDWRLLDDQNRGQEENIYN